MFNFHSLTTFIRSYSKRVARPRLISKHGNKDYYKGNGGGGKIGHHTKNGGFIIDPKKVRDFVVPDLSTCTLRPYVAHTTPLISGPRSMTVENYIEEALKNKMTQ